MNSNFQHITKVRYLIERISSDISLGQYPVGSLLPSINAISRDYDVSRDTVFKALIELKERNMIDSIPGKGYYVLNRQKNILLLLDEYSLFKDVLYNSLVRRLPSYYKIDLWFHQYNEKMFNAILLDSIGKYNHYLIMNFNNDRMSGCIKKIDPSKLLLLDFGNFDKKDYSYICQDFGESFYSIMLDLTERIKKYNRLVLYASKKNKHPHETTEYFIKYCKEQNLEYAIVDSMQNREILKGDIIIAFCQRDIVECVKIGRSYNLKCGDEYGIIAYNDTPAYEVIDKGITSIGIDWEKMGKMMADFVLNNRRIQVFLPTEVHLRGSL